MPDTGPALQADRQHNLLLHTVGRDAAHIRADRAPARRTEAEHWGNNTRRLVLRMARWSAGTTPGRLVYYQVH